MFLCYGFLISRNAVPVPVKEPWRVKIHWYLFITKRSKAGYEIRIILRMYWIFNWYSAMAKKLIQLHVDGIYDTAMLQSMRQNILSWFSYNLFSLRYSSPVYLYVIHYYAPNFYWIELIDKMCRSLLVTQSFKHLLHFLMLQFIWRSCTDATLFRSLDLMILSLNDPHQGNSYPLKVHIKTPQIDNTDR